MENRFDSLFTFLQFNSMKPTQLSAARHSKSTTLHKRLVRISVIFLPLFVVLNVTGCHFLNPCEPIPDIVVPRLVNSFRWGASPNFQQFPPRKIVVLNSQPGRSSSELPHQFAENLSAEFKAKGLFDVVVPHTMECNTTIDEIAQGRFDERELVEIATFYNADAILIFRINEFKYYPPMQANITVGILDAREAVLGFAADGFWDLSEPETYQNFSDYLNYRRGGQDASHLRVQQQSPSSFSSYVAMQIAEAVAQSRRVDRADYRSSGYPQYSR